jgi:hypothetical protein
MNDRAATADILSNPPHGSYAISTKQRYWIGVFVLTERQSSVQELSSAQMWIVRYIPGIHTHYMLIVVE